MDEAVSGTLPSLPGLRLAEARCDGVVAKPTIRDGLRTASGVRHGGRLMALGDTMGAAATVLDPHVRQG
jgi:acyl-coenzyme A thioesterase PaaI-like protein